MIFAFSLFIRMQYNFPYIIYMLMPALNTVKSRQALTEVLVACTFLFLMF